MQSSFITDGTSVHFSISYLTTLKRSTLVGLPISIYNFFYKIWDIYNIGATDVTEIDVTFEKLQGLDGVRYLSILTVVSLYQKLNLHVKRSKKKYRR